MNGIIEIVVFVIGVYLSGFCNVLCYAKLNNKVFLINKKNILIILLTALLATINVYVNPVMIKAILNLTIVSIELKWIFKDNFRKVIINYIILQILLLLSEVILTNTLLYTNILTNSTSANTINYINIILTVLVGLIQYSIVLIKPFRKILKKMVDFLISITNINYIIYIIYIAICIIAIINVQNFANQNSVQLITILFTIFLILFASIIKLRLNEENLKISNKRLIDYNDNYGKFLDEYKIYKHNIKHKLSAMKIFGNKKINNLIDELLEEETTFSIRNNNIYNIPNGIKGIVAEKLYNKNYNVIINNRIKDDPFIKLNAKAFNSVSECIGIVLDNAIEASEETKHPLIIMDIYDDKENIYIKVGNNFNNNIDIEKLGDKYYSTKNRGSGLGLFSVFRNNLISEKINIINDMYYIELLIKKAQ